MKKVNENEIQELKQELEMLICFIADHGTEQESTDKCVTYSCVITDALDWILGEIETERFRSDEYLNIKKLYDITRKIEQRTGKNLIKSYSESLVRDEKTMADLTDDDIKKILNDLEKNLKDDRKKSLEQRTGKKD